MKKRRLTKNKIKVFENHKQHIVQILLKDKNLLPLFQNKKQDNNQPTDHYLLIRIKKNQKNNKNLKTKLSLTKRVAAQVLNLPYQIEA